MISSTERVLVTGSSGFIGQAVVSALLKAGRSVTAVVRQSSDQETFKEKKSALTFYRIAEINRKTDWRHSFRDVTTVVHCAGLSHVRRASNTIALAAYREVNVEGTQQLAQQAAAAGIRRFIYISSIKVNGENTNSGQAFTEADIPLPQSAYAHSKAEAEKHLFALGQKTGLDVVIIRPPLVVGPGVKGNLASMIRWVQSGIPLPLGALHNKRSIVSLNNLVHFILLCEDRNKSPQAANQLFVVADGQDVSTTILLNKIADASGYPSRLFPFPASFLRMSAILLGNRAMADRLLDNLQVDSTKAQTLLGWYPPETLDDQLAVMFQNK